MLSIHIQPFFLQSVSLVYATNELSFFFRSSSFTLSLASFIIVKVKNGLKMPVLLDLYQIQLKNATFSQKTHRNIWWNGIFAVLLHPLSRTPPRWLFKKQQKIEIFERFTQTEKQYKSKLPHYLQCRRFGQNNRSILGKEHFRQRPENRQQTDRVIYQKIFYNGEFDPGSG